MSVGLAASATSGPRRFITRVIRAATASRDSASHVSHAGTMAPVCRSSTGCPSRHLRTVVRAADGNETNDSSLAPAVHMVKKSRFIARAVHVSDWDLHGREAVQRLAALDPQAGHHCYGFLPVDGAQPERYSDDGEPGGTAGRPIVGAIRSLGMADVLCVVARHYGGVKLGTGGLARAYAAAARDVLQQLPSVEINPGDARVQVVVSAPLQHWGRAMGAISALGASVQRDGAEELVINGDDAAMASVSPSDTADHNVMRLRLDVAASEVDRVEESLRNACGRHVRVVRRGHAQQRM